MSTSDKKDGDAIRKFVPSYAVEGFERNWSDPEIQVVEPQYNVCVMFYALGYQQAIANIRDRGLAKVYSDLLLVRAFTDKLN